MNAPDVVDAPVPHAGRLVLVPNALDLGDPDPPPLLAVLPSGVIHRAAGLTHWIVEDAKTARAFLKRVQAVEPLAQPLQQISLVEMPRAPKGARSNGLPSQGPEGRPADWQALLEPALAGHDIGLLSEAGLPAVADPGAAIVAAAHAKGMEVEVLPGPSALLLALAASGLDGNAFVYHGYLPAREPERGQVIRRLEQESRRDGRTQLCIETPYRNAALLAALLQHLQPGSRLAVSCGLTQAGGFNRSATVAHWRQRPIQMPDRLPAVFCFSG